MLMGGPWIQWLQIARNFNIYGNFYWSCPDKKKKKKKNDSYRYYNLLVPYLYQIKKENGENLKKVW